MPDGERFGARGGDVGNVPAPSGRPGGGDGDPWQEWKWFAVALAAGAGLVFLFEIVQLVLSVPDLHEGHEKGAVWAMLLMIFVTLGTVAVIGGGLLLALRREGDGADASPGEERG